MIIQCFSVNCTHIVLMKPFKHRYSMNLLWIMFVFRTRSEINPKDKVLCKYVHVQMTWSCEMGNWLLPGSGQKIGLSSHPHNLLYISVTVSCLFLLPIFNKLFSIVSSLFVCQGLQLIKGNLLWVFFDSTWQNYKCNDAEVYSNIISGKGFQCFKTIGVRTDLKEI